MKKVILVIVVLVIAITAFSLVVAGGDQDQKKNKKVTSATVQKDGSCDHIKGSAECLEARTKGECKCACSEKCSGKHANGECTDIKAGSAECIAKHGKRECTGHKPGECR